MSDIIVFAARAPAAHRGMGEYVKQLGAHLHGPPLPRRSNLVADAGWAVSACLSATPTTLRHEASFCSGALRHPRTDWWQTGSAAPDGTYALARVSQDAVECLTDFTGSRALWFFADADCFVASTSERAIVALLASFEPNDEAVPWMLSAGNPGFGRAWDRRIRLLPPNRRLVLKRSGWQLLELPGCDDSDERSGPDGGQVVGELEQILTDMQLSSPSWTLSLSGGCDSRAILAGLPGAPWTTVAWGTAQTRFQPGFDLYVADQLAARYATHHHVLPLALAEDVESMLADFVAHSEGRSDHLAGYIDGFGIWRHIVDLGADGMLRGDELFGSASAVSRALSWANMGLARFADYAPTRSTRLLAAAYPQAHPAQLRPAPTETEPAWRNRLRAQFEQPGVLATLNQVRSRYVEMANPLLFRALTRAAQQWPDDWTTGKAYFKDLVQPLVPEVPFAVRTSITSRQNLYADSHFRSMLLDHLSSQAGRELIPAEVGTIVGRTLGRSEGALWGALRTVDTKLRRIIAVRERRFSIRGALPVFDVRDLALRSLIVNLGRQLLSRDAAFGATLASAGRSSADHATAAPESSRSAPASALGSSS